MLSKTKTLMKHNPRVKEVEYLLIQKWNTIPELLYSSSLFSSSVPDEDILAGSSPKSMKKG